MGVVSQLASQMRDATTRNPARVEVADVVQVYCLLYAGAALLEQLQQQLTEADNRYFERLSKPPMVIRSEPPPGTVIP